jgi:hypothetical protein
MARKPGGVKVKGTVEAATIAGDCAKAMVSGAVARALAAETWAVSSAAGAIARAEADDARAQALVGGAEARAEVYGSQAEAMRDGSRAVSVARGAKALALDTGAVARAEHAGAVAFAETTGARAVAAVPGAVAFGTFDDADVLAESDGAIVLCVGRLPVGKMPDDVPLVADLHRKVYKACLNPGALNMIQWHSLCGTTHCRAGWVVTLAGAAGKALESAYGPAVAAAMIYAKAYPDQPTPDFYEWCNEAALDDIRACAERSSRIG